MGRGCEMTNEEFEEFAKVMGLKAMLLLIQRSGKEGTANGEAPDADFVAKIPRLLEILEAMCDEWHAFSEDDIMWGMTRVLARAAMRYGRKRKMTEMAKAKAGRRLAKETFDQVKD